MSLGFKKSSIALFCFLFLFVQYILGTKMVFPGLKKPQDRGDEEDNSINNMREVENSLEG